VADEVMPGVNTGWLAAAFAALLPMVAAVFAWAGRQWEKRRDRGEKERDDLVTDLRGQLGDHKSEIALLREQNGQLRSLNERYRDDHAGCREDLTGLWGNYALLWDAAVRHLAAIRKLGGDVEDLPPRPEAPQRPPRQPDTDFLRRTAAQGQILLDEFHQQKAGGGNAGQTGGAAGPCD
jgi:hypothetical protein